MNLFNVERLAECLCQLSIRTHECDEETTGGQGAGTIYEDSYIDDLHSEVQDLRKVCLENGFNDAAEEIQETDSRIKHDMTVDALFQALKRMDYAVAKELRNFKVIPVQNDRAKYVDAAELFADLKSAFPSAIDDLIEAANCLAVECSTACVFHAMRAAEIGLRALAWDRRVQMPSNRPIEFSNWEAILKGLDKAESEIINYPVTVAREAQLAFYHSAMMEFRAFKNKFRNPAMHSRERFDRDEAKSALTHVVDFLRVLSKIIGEGKRTPKVWRRVGRGSV